jgi:hypothetical protein
MMYPTDSCSSSNRIDHRAAVREVCMFQSALQSQPSLYTGDSQLNVLTLAAYT